MALFQTAVPILKYTKPLLVQPCLLPGGVNMQVRYAARKGYREKVKSAKKEAVKLNPRASKQAFQMRGKVVKFEKTVDLKKPEPPPDDVIIRDNFNYFKYSLSEAVKLHREYHHPTTYNNPNAPVNLRIEVNMTGKSEFQFIKPFSGIASIPNPFVISFKKEVLVLCKPEDVDLAISHGASAAGGVELIKKIKEGAVQPSLYEYIIAHISLHAELSPIRGILKNQMPRAKNGTLTNDLPAAIHRYLHGIEYSCVQLGAAKEIGFISCSIGLINMELNQLEENFKALLEDIVKHRPKKDKQFISWIWCSSPPSDESFSIDLSQYIKSEKADDDDDDDEDEDAKDSEKNEKIARRALRQEYEEEEIKERA